MFFKKTYALILMCLLLFGPQGIASLLPSRRFPISIFAANSDITSEVWFQKSEQITRRDGINGKYFLADTGENTVKYFNSMGDFLESPYFRNPRRPTNVYCKIKGSSTLFEIVSAPQEKELNKIILREIDYGESRSASLLNQPITKCAYSHSQTGSIAISKSGSFSQSFNHVHGFLLSASYSVELMDVLSAALLGLLNNLAPGISAMSIGLNLAVEVDNQYSFSRSFGGSVSCESGPGNITQLFVSARYIYYPEAKVRYSAYSKTGKHNIELIGTGPWEKAYSSETYPEYGLVVYDNSHGAEFACVNKQEYLQCDSTILFNVFDPRFDPVEGLHHALASTT